MCNQQEAGLLFSDDYGHLAPDEMCRVLAANVHSANIPSMVITMGGQGAVYARANGECGVVPAKKVDVIDTTGAGDAFFAGTTIGLTYGKIAGRVLRDRQPTGRIGHLHHRERLPPLPPAGIRAEHSGGGLSNIRKPGRLRSARLSF